MLADARLQESGWGPSWARGIGGLCDPIHSAQAGRVRKGADKLRGLAHVGSHYSPVSLLSGDIDFIVWKVVWGESKGPSVLGPGIKVSTRSHHALTRFIRYKALGPQH